MYPPSINKDWNESYIDVINNTTLWGHLLPNEIVYLDMPILAHNKTSYLVTNTIAISPNQQYVAYTLDENGGEVYQLYVKHIESNKVYTIYNTETLDEALQCDGSVVWNNANDVLFYVTQDNTTKRSHKLYSHRIFNSTGHWIDTCDQVDVLLLEEEDGSFNVRIAKTFDGRYLLIRLSSKESSEVHYLDLQSDDVKEEQEMTRTANHNLVCIAKRAHKVLYRVTHCQGYWLVQTNIGGLPNLSLKACRVGKDGMENWKDVIINNNDVPSIPVFSGGHERSLDGVTVFHPSFEEATDPNHSPPLAYAIITGREDGMPRVWALELSVKDGTNDNDDIGTLTVTSMTRLEFDEDAYDVGIGGVRDPCLPYVVISYDSLITPPSHIAVPLSRPSELSVRKVLKVKTVPGYNKDSYACERTTVKSRDGKTDIPVSLVYHRDVLTDRCGPIHPVHLYGYGSYGASIEASFRSTRLPLLKRGFVYVLAHVRGGGELGRPWYDDAKFLAKKNSFNDFVDVALWLVDDSINANDTIESTIGRGITRPSKLSCEGQSAGGLLVGASLNQRPDLFRAAILGVPFVDVTCTMIDSTIPLTIAEWSEWGNPNEEKYFDYITSYSPINNVKDGSVYPTCLITGGLNDRRVAYWEPTKYCAELRHKISDKSGPVLLKMNMDSGHSSGSDRYKYFRDFAFDYAFLLDALSS
jgi:oligopeptidase B